MKWFATKITIIIVFEIFINFTSAEVEDQVITAVIFYEPLCPYTEGFIKQEVNPFFEGHLSKFVKLKIVPYDSRPAVGKFLCNGNRRTSCSLGMIVPTENNTNIHSNSHCLKRAIQFIRYLRDQFQQVSVDDIDQKCEVAALGSHFPDIHKFPKVQLGTYYPINNDTLDELQSTLDNMSQEYFGSQKEFQSHIFYSFDYNPKKECIERLQRSNSGSYGKYSINMLAPLLLLVLYVITKL
ncbi:uncharacterized protein LOC126881202 [Diabrotica virgifera virgifera]|uniref:GILT-like protein 1 n=1 Tax=Diabrotica virgifera virgifera TaxID=50390 RepID=A0ABM5JTJ8_DIAVI|nr:uncharacterized protein LOC126881202 [Diabrotica virgifera virgifera]